jgi:endoglycosylceramidase
MKLLQIVGILLLSMCNCTYKKKLFYSPQKNKSVYIKDSTNRIVVYHGLNISNYSKSSVDFLPWQTKDDFAKIKIWGFNLVRYLVFWQAIEPVKGQYNKEYIQKTLERIQWLKELGIDVVIDVHQDLYSAKFTGNGFPHWTIHDNGIKFNQRKPWNMNYFEPAVIESYNYFWRSDELKTDYINMLQFLLSNVDSFDNVVGIDVMNEPFLGTILSFEKNTLTKFYDKIQVMMIANNFKTEMFFEPMMYTSGGIPSDLRFVLQRDCSYYPHYYDAFCHEGKAYKSFNKTVMQRAIAIKLRESQDFNSPLLIGEFGISPSVEGHLQYLKDLVSIMDKNLIGWTYYTYDKKTWSDFGIVDNDGNPTELLQPLVNVYAQKIAGKNPQINRDENQFMLDYEIDASITGQTEIFIPQLDVTSITVNDMSFPVVSNQVFKFENDIGKKHICVLIVWK